MSKTDFAKIIAELVASGHSYAFLADKCGCSETYIKQLASGHRGQKGPNYDMGVKLKELHEGGQK